MNKRQIIDEILLLNHSAKPEFLAQFDDDELDAYLRHLQLAQTPRLTSTQGQYARYFENVPMIDADGDPVEAADPGQTQGLEPVASRDDDTHLIEATLFSDDLDDDLCDRSQIGVAANDHRRDDTDRL